MAFEVACIIRARSYMRAGARYSSCLSLECSHRRFQEATTRTNPRGCNNSIVHAFIVLYSWWTGLANQIGEPGFFELKDIDIPTTFFWITTCLVKLLLSQLFLFARYINVFTFPTNYIHTHPKLVLLQLQSRIICDWLIHRAF